MSSPPKSPSARIFEIVDFDDFESLVENTQPPALKPSRLRVNQAAQIKEFLANRQRPCKSIVVERRYTDRAFMDEYREFYAASFQQYSNYCSRLHFFELEKRELKTKLKELAKNVLHENATHSQYLLACKEFSELYYLGFMVVKPLPATRIGRTVIRHPRHEKDEIEKGFPCTRVYTAHVFGLEFTVCGLPFQQQDGGMSACASTALWASLSQYAEYERIQVPSPAAITKWAAGHATQFGRSIPQEQGLTTAQMCRAMEATGLSPYLVILGKDGDQVHTRAMLYSVVRSGFAPILILSREGESHAVTVAGMTLGGEPHETILEKIKLIELSGRLQSLFINDDRLGPYRVAHLTGARGLDIEVPFGDIDSWNITHLIIPLHPKIRLAFNSLYEFANLAADQIGIVAEDHPEEVGGFSQQTSLEFWIAKSRVYRRQALYGEHRLAPVTAHKLNQHFAFSRYVGIVRLADESFGTIDIILDLTNTSRHMNVLLVLGRGRLNPSGKKLVEYLAENFGSSFLIDG